MPTVTIYTSTGPRWGDSGFNSNTDYLKVGKSGSGTYYGRVGFPAINPTWYIKSIKLRMKRIDSYSSKVLKVGSRPDGDWATKTSTDFAQEIAVSSGENTKEWDLTAHKGILQGYTGTWYMHVRHGSGDNSYCEFTGGTGSSSPRLVIEYEEATLSVPGGEFTIGTASAIAVGTIGSGLTHKVSYSIGASSGALNGGTSVNAGGTINWTPAAALANEIKDSMTGTVTLTLESFLNGTPTSTLLLMYPLKVPASYVPVINSGSTTVSLQNPAGDTVGVYVQGRSKAVCAINVTTSYGAPIKEYKLTIGGKTYTVPAGTTAVNPFSITTDELTATGALTAVIEVTDTRGQKATLTRASAVTMNAYFAPMVTGLSLTRALSDQTPSNEGTYIKFTLTCVFAPIANKNTKAGSIRFKTSGGAFSSPISLDAAMAAAGATVYSFTITGVIGGGTIGAGGYIVGVSLADRYTTAPEVLAELPSKKIYFDLHFSGEGMAIGKVADTASLFDVGLDSRFDGVVSLGAGGQYGNKNELTNPTFLTNTTGWNLHTNVTVDATRQLMGCNSIKSAQSGLGADSYRGIHPSPLATYALPTVVGEWRSCSWYVYIADYSTFAGNIVGLELIEYDAAGVRLATLGSAIFTPTANDNGKWKRLTVSKAATSTNCAYVMSSIWVRRNGTAWFACPKLEKGPLATEFMANVEGDVNFKGAVGFAEPAAVRASMGIQTGSASFTAPASGTVDVTVTFPKPYAVAPTVFPVLVGPPGNTNVTWMAVSSVTATSAVVRVLNDHTSSRGMSLNWLAIGTLV